jgi:peptide/nickel transport system substrate-binding protein
MQELRAGTFDPNKDVLGTGPFMMTQHLQGESWTFGRNPSYWRTGYPKADKVVVRAIPDVAARIAALRDATVDIADFGDVDAPRLLKGTPNVTAVTQNSTNTYRLELNGITPNTPFFDQRVRRAFAMAIDRQQILDLALGAVGKISGPISPLFKSSCDLSQMPTYKRDLAAAKQLLADANAQNATINMIVTAAQSTTVPQIAQVIQQNEAQIGLKVKITQMDSGAWLLARRNLQFDGSIAVFGGWADPGIVPNWWTNGVYKFIVKDPTLVQLVDQANSQPNGPARDQLLQKVCTQIDEKANMLVLDTVTGVVAYRSDRITVKIQPVEGYLDTLRHIQEFTRVA